MACLELQDIKTDKFVLHPVNALKNIQEDFNIVSDLSTFNKKRKPNGYWREETILIELKLVIKKLGHFPSRSELHKMNRRDLIGAINKHGGDIKFRKMLGYKPIHKPYGYWTEETTIIELKLIIEKLKHFPSAIELHKMKRSDLSRAITLLGGFIYFRELLKYKIIKKPDGYWSDKNIINEVKLVIEKINHFPTQTDLKNLDRHDLIKGISKNGGYLKFRGLLGYETTYKLNNYWNEENTIIELKLVIKELNHFPTQKELKGIKRSDLAVGISKNGGLNYFRELLGYKFFYKPVGYWNDDTILIDLKIIIEKLGYFPSRNELYEINRKDLVGSINVHGGFLKFRKLCGFNVSLQEKYKSELSSYVDKRGKASELLVKRIIQDWLEIHNLPEVSCNVKLAPKNVLEFICDIGKTIGIDVTNTNTKHTVTKKWRYKNYHKNLDELWIVVFSGKFTEKDYNNWNYESPENVRIMSIDEFLENLDYFIDTELQTKIDKYKKCTFRNKREYLNKSICNYS